MIPALGVVGILLLAVVAFILIRTLYWLLVEIPRDHAKDEAICEICLGKTRNDKVTEPLEWCDCPQRENADKHKHECTKNECFPENHDDRQDDFN